MTTTKTGSAEAPPGIAAWTGGDRNRRAIRIALVLSVWSVVASTAALLISLGFFGGMGAQPDFAGRAREYLLANPEIVLEAADLARQRELGAEQNEITSAIAELQSDIFESPTSPVGGNVAGDVTLVEFFDYNCPYCREATPIVDQLLSEDENLRLVYKEFPILGPGSEFAARAALASQKQGKYLDFHSALMAASGAVNEATTMEVAREIGLDLDQLRRDMEDPFIQSELAKNFSLADALRLSGTPAFISGNTVVRGLADLGAMQQLIEDARQVEGP